MQLAGGAGFVIIVAAVVEPSAGVGLHRAGGRGSQLVPGFGESARLVLVLCSVYAVVGTAAYVTAGMTVFDAINHAFAAVSTGGFSTHPDKLGHWDSPAIEAITIVLMVLGSLNFVTVWLLARRRFRPALANGEIKVLGLLMAAGCLLLFLLGVRTAYPALGKAARVAVFESVSALTTTGLSTVRYGEWARGTWLVLIGLMIVGGGSCSTAGGLKQMRVYRLARTVIRQVRRISLPRTAVLADRAWDGDGAVAPTEAQLRETGTFFFLYLSTLGAGTLVLAAHGIPLDEALFEFASSLGTVGLSVGVTSASLQPAVLWTQIAGMFLGRLELFVVLAVLAAGLRGFSRLAASALRRSSG
jgi:trk system potassium uptake protein TrkH